MAKPEEEARQTIDAALELAGWQVQDAEKANLTSCRGTMIRQLSEGSANTFPFCSAKCRK